MSAGLHYEPYRAARSTEWMMRIGEADAPPILFVPPLLEEMNRTRALIAATMRLLAGRGFGCWMMDLSGTGESETPIEDIDPARWREDVAAAAAHAGRAAGTRPLVASIRGGGLVDDEADAIGWWRLAPVSGASLVRDLRRAEQSGGAEGAGYSLPASLIIDLECAVPAAMSPLRTVRLTSDPSDADIKVPGAPLWRRSEPGTSAELASAIAEDIATWTRQCAAS